MAQSEIQCSYCGKHSMKENGSITRALKLGANLFCNRTCAGLGRRNNKTDQERKEEKRLYDIEYRADNSELLKVKKAKYFQEQYNPELEAVKRKQYKADYPEREQARLAHMATPECKMLKKKYDRKYKAVEKYGEEWADCAVLALEIRDECLSKQTAYEIRLNAGTLNKSQHRRRDYERLNSSKLENSPLGYS